MVGAMAKSIPEKLEEVEVQRAKLAQREKRLTEKAKRLKHQQQYKTRKEETRRKIITGGALLAAVRDGMVSQALLAHVLNRYVTRKSEREFMGIEERDEAENGGAGEVGER